MLSKKKAFEILNLPANTSILEARNVARSLIQKYHPDKGSDDIDSFMRIRSAYDTLRRICPTCNSTKVVTVIKGVAKVTKPCPDCQK